MKKLSNALALLLALLIAFGVSASAIDLPDDLGSLPALSLGETAGSVPLEPSALYPDYGYIEGEAWYRFTPAEDGYYLAFAAGGYHSGNTDWVSVYFPEFYDAAGAALYRPWQLSKDEDYCIRVCVSGQGEATSCDITVTLKYYQYTNVLPYHKTPSSSLETALKGSDYKAADVEFSYTRENGYDKYLDIYFFDGVYTTIEVGSFSLADIYAVEGVFGVVKTVVGWLGLVPFASPLLLFLGLFFFWTFVAPFFTTPVAIIIFPFTLLFLPFSLLALVLNLF